MGAPRGSTPRTLRAPRAHAVPASVIVPASFTLTSRNAGEGVYDVFLTRKPLSIRISNTHGCDDAHEISLAQRRGETSIHDESFATGHVRLWQGKTYRIDACLDSDSAGNSLAAAATCSALAASRDDADLAYAICRSLELVLDQRVAGSGSGAQLAGRARSRAGSTIVQLIRLRGSEERGRT